MKAKPGNEIERKVKAAAKPLKMAPQNDESRADGNSKFVTLPEKRGNRANSCSSILFASVTIIVATILIKSPDFVFKEDKDAVCTRKNSSESLICYKKEEKHLAGFLAITFGILSAILGTLLQRLSLVAEECRDTHRQNRYGGSWTKMLKACFSGVRWQAVMCAVMAFVAIICVIFSTDEDFKHNGFKYFVVILSSIGFGPLVLQLLNLDTLSEVQISTIIENQENCGLGYNLAWFYYFSYLQNKLPLIKRSIQASGWRDRHISYKLFILIPHQCDTTKIIEDLDDRFRKEGVINCNELYSVGLYRMQFGNNQSRYFAMEYASPLRILRDMSIYEPVSFVPYNKCDEELQMFHQTLADILKTPLKLECKNTCELIVFDPSATENGTTELKDCLFSKLLSQKVSRGGSQGVPPGVSRGDSRGVSQRVPPGVSRGASHEITIQDGMRNIKRPGNLKNSNASNAV